MALLTMPSRSTAGVPLIAASIVLRASPGTSAQLCPSIAHCTSLVIIVLRLKIILPCDIAMPRAPPIHYLYIDYHDVLDSGNDMLLNMVEFLVRVSELEIIIILLSFGFHRRNQKTLRELEDANIADLFDRIVFTRQRTRHEGNGHGHRLTKWRYRYHRNPPQDYATQHKSQNPQDGDEESPNQAVRVMEETEYEVYTGGKDEFIHRNHGRNPYHRILVVDDKAETLKAVCEEHEWLHTPGPQGIEMRRHYFKTTPPLYSQCSSLEQLLQKIRAWVHTTTNQTPIMEELILENERPQTATNHRTNPAECDQCEQQENDRACTDCDPSWIGWRCHTCESRPCES